MAQILSPALQASLAQGEEVTATELTEKLEKAQASFSKAVAAVHSGKADPSTLDVFINGSSGTPAPSNLAALPPAASSKPRIAELATRLEGQPDGETAAEYLTQVLDGTQSIGKQRAILAIARGMKGYEVDDKTGELLPVKTRDAEIRELNDGLQTIGQSLDPKVGRNSGDSHKDYAERIANEVKASKAAAPAPTPAPAATTTMPAAPDTTKTKAAITAATDLIEKGHTGPLGGWVVDKKKKDQVVKDLQEAEKSL